MAERQADSVLTGQRRVHSDRIGKRRPSARPEGTTTKTLARHALQARRVQTVEVVIKNAALI
jgi:hypothetical protein